ncbi:MAG: uridine kinase [Bacteroidaceae bacterium]|nr:uridine kinase [Bacteroidaceae bacterium]
MYIIGIAGGTGSGKTTVVKKIMETLRNESVAVIPQDSYYNDNTLLSMEERKRINYDHPDAFDWKLLYRHIHDLRNGKAIEQPTYDYITSNRMTETIHIEPCEVIIIEGIMALYRKDMRDLMDLKIFVDTDSDVRLIRNILRDTVERGRTPQMVIDRYLQVLKPMHEEFIEPTKRFADLIIPEGGCNEQAVDIMKTYIKHRLRP